MNPSRITTPLDKKIDEWWFRYLDRPLKWAVYLHRTRDIEAEVGGKFESYFYALPDEKSLKKLNLADFPRERIQGDSFDDLRTKVAALINSWLNATWEKVMVIYLEESKPQMTFDNSRLLSDQNAIKFDYVICYRSKDSTFWKKPGSLYVSRRMNDMLSNCGSAGSFKAVEYSEELEASLKTLGDKLKVLAIGLRQLVFERTDEFIQWSNGPVQLLPP